MRGHGRLDSFETILAGVAHRLGLESKLVEARVRRRWPELVDAAIAEQTRPDHIRFKKLYILVRHSVWLQQLSFLKPELLRKVNDQAGEPLITDIVLRIGDWPADAATTALDLEPADLSPPPAPDLLKEAAHHTRTIHDPVLRDRLTAVMAQALSRTDPAPRPSRPGP